MPLKTNLNHVGADKLAQGGSRAVGPVCDPVQSRVGGLPDSRKGSGDIQSRLTVDYHKVKDVCMCTAAK